MNHCPKCNSIRLIRQNGGERGESGPWYSCLDCDWTEEPAPVRRVDPVMLQLHTDLILDILTAVINVALVNGMEFRMGGLTGAAKAIADVLARYQVEAKQPPPMS